MKYLFGGIYVTCHSPDWFFLIVTNGWYNERNRKQIKWFWVNIIEIGWSEVIKDRKTSYQIEKFPLIWLVVALNLVKEVTEIVSVKTCELDAE